MATRRGRGRPPRDEVVVTPEVILAQALGMLTRDGAEALTMRALAARLGVNPMTIYHHFGDRNGLIKAMAEAVYLPVAVSTRGDIRQRIESLMLSYHARVVQHPALTLIIFGMPAVFPDQAKRISSDLLTLLRQLGLSPRKARVWLHILVDFTHGAALAVAMTPPRAKRSIAKHSASDDYAAALTALLGSLEATRTGRKRRTSK